MLSRLLIPFVSIAISTRAEVTSTVDLEHISVDVAKSTIEPLTVVVMMVLTSLFITTVRRVTFVFVGPGIQAISCAVPVSTPVPIAKNNISVEPCVPLSPYLKTLRVWIYLTRLTRIMHVPVAVYTKPPKSAHITILSSS